MNTNTLLHIYQAYSLEKMNALSKKSLAMQYEQNGQLMQLNRQLAESNAATNRMLQNQIKELERQENVRFYKNLIFKMNLALDKIENQPIANYKLFLSSLFLKPIEAYSKESIEILEDIKDKEYAQHLIERTQTIALSNKEYEVGYNQSAWISYLPTKEATEDNSNKLAIRKKEFEIKKLEKKRPKRKIKKEKTKKTKKVLSTGCLVIAILFFLFMTISMVAMFATNEPAASGGIPVVIISAIIVLILWVFRKRSCKENVETAKDKDVYGDEQNDKPLVNEEVEIDEYEQKILQLKKDIDNLKTEDKGKKDCFESISAAVNAECSNWEEQMNEILEMLPHETEPEKKIDSLIESAAKNAVLWQSVSAGTIQRKFVVGYNRACEIIEQMEQLGIIAKNEKGDYDVLCENEEELKSLLKEENII
jgi:hypothetical protein